MDLDRRIAAFRDSSAATPGVTSIVLYGSSASDAAHRRDEWSDVDAGVFLAPEHADELRRTWAFLPDREHLVLTAREGDNGGVALWDDGTLAEFGAGLPWVVRDPQREVVRDGGDLHFADPDPLPTAEDAVGLFLVKLLIGVGRVRRGERAAGSSHVRTYALTQLAEALRQRLAPDAPRGPFDPLRRFEAALPEDGARIAELLDAPVEDCARGLLELAVHRLAPGWPQFPLRAAQVVAHRLGWPDPTVAR